MRIPRLIRTPERLQFVATECGAASLAAIFEYYGSYFSLSELRNLLGISRDGSSGDHLVGVAQQLGFTVEVHRGSAEDLVYVAPPCILWWERKHFLVYEGFRNGTYFLNDPSAGRRKISKAEFSNSFSEIAIQIKPVRPVRRAKRPSFFKKLLALLGQYPTVLLYSLLLVLTYAVLLPTVPVIMNFFTNYVITDGLSYRSRLLAWLIVFFGGVSAIALLLSSLLLTRLANILSYLFSLTFLYYLIRLPYSFFMTRFSGELANRVSLSEKFANSLSSEALQSFSAFSSLLILVPTLLLTSFPLGLLIFAIYTFTFWLTRTLSEVRQSQQNVQLQQLASLQGLAVILIARIDFIKAAGWDRQVFDLFSTFHGNTLNAQQGLGKSDTYLQNIPLVLERVINVCVVFIGAYLVISKEIFLGTVVAFQGYSSLIALPINQLSTIIDNYQTLYSTSERMEDALRERPDPGYTPFESTLFKAFMRREKTLPPVDTDSKPAQLVKVSPEEIGDAPAVHFEGVCFAYSLTSPQVLQNLSFELKEGQHLAVVGRSGCGKSTIASLASGLVLPTRGSIRLFGRDLQDLTWDERCTLLGYVTQDASVFEGTLLFNLTFGLEDYDRAKLNDLLEATRLLESISYPDPLNYPVTLQGNNLSGGQRQRIEIIRALLRKPRLLILDEATSALDSVTEQRIMSYLQQQDLSIISIAHRLTTVAYADSILVLESGLIAEQGNYAELSEREGLFRTLVQISSAA